MQRFTDQTIIVTGAGSGIGAATARRFAAEGARVVLAGRNADKLNDVAQGMSAALVQVTDVTDPADLRRLVDAAIARFGAIHVLVNNAGTASFGDFATMEDAQWDRTMRVNVDGTFHAIRTALPHLLASRGCIVNVSSVSGLGGDWGLAFYNASKGAVSNLTRALALELGGKGVRVNAVAPSLTRTDMAADVTGNAALMEKFAERIPLGRPAEPAEIAAVIAFLASADAAFVNGVVLPVDGGLHASNGQPRML